MNCPNGEKTGDIVSTLPELSGQTGDNVSTLPEVFRLTCDNVSTLLEVSGQTGDIVSTLPEERVGVRHKKSRIHKKYVSAIVVL
jgi:hypothetical protein